MEGGRWHSHVKYLLVKPRKNEVSSWALCAAIVCFLTRVDRRQEGPAASHRTVRPDKWSRTRAVGASTIAVVLLVEEEQREGRLGGGFPLAALSCMCWVSCARNARDLGQGGQRVTFWDSVCEELSHFVFLFIL